MSATAVFGDAGLAARVAEVARLVVLDHQLRQKVVPDTFASRRPMMKEGRSLQN